MELVLGPKKPLPEIVTRPKAGHYALDRIPFNFQKCRDNVFDIFTEETEGLFFSHEDNQHLNVVAFISKVEDILNLEEKSICSPTGFSFTTWVIPSKFWKNCPIKRSLFTLFLRSGMMYDCEKNNFDEALVSDVECYGKDTIVALKRFLFGFTYYDNEASKKTIYDCYAKFGWHTVFKNKPQEDVCKILLRPKEISATPCLVGIGRLWQ